MKKLEPEILDFHKKQAQIAKMQVALSKIEETVIEKYCPFKKGDCVWFRLHPTDKEKPGIINNIHFDGINFDAINNRWEIQIRPTRKDFSPIQGRHNMYFPTLNKQSTVRKA